MSGRIEDACPTDEVTGVRWTLRPQPKAVAQGTMGSRPGQSDARYLARRVREPDRSGHRLTDPAAMARKRPS